ncbi:HNH endonuclease [Macrococcoides caseolyticum]|uniref:HNH endonuclease n=1 Tax=Macrococcoides caseolyticum TaxID=69966 RepID=UPI0030EF433F
MKNKYRFKDGLFFIEVFHKENRFECILDEESFSIVKEHKGRWSIKNDGYPYANIRQLNGSFKKVSMQRFIMKPQKDMIVDHINRNILDFRKSNLRIVTRGQNTQNISINGNSRNTTGHRNICRRGKKYEVQVKGEYLGRFETLEEAIKVRDNALKELQPYAFESLAK